MPFLMLTGELSEWLKEPASKTGVRQRTGGSNPSLTAQCNANQNAARKCGAFQLVDYLIFPDNWELLGLALDDVDDADDSEDKENNIQDPCYESQSRDFADDEAYNPAKQENKALI